MVTLTNELEKQSVINQLVLRKWPVDLYAARKVKSSRNQRGFIFDESEHPRADAGSVGGIGGEFIKKDSSSQKPSPQRAKSITADLGDGFSIASPWAGRLNILRGQDQVGHVNFNLDGKRAQIDDATLDKAARGNGLMKKIYPLLVDHFRSRGVTHVVANTVDDAVGEKVWRPLGFQLVGQHGSVGAKIWRHDFAEQKYSSSATESIVRYTQAELNRYSSQEFDSDKHPRFPAGSPDGTGGRFAHKLVKIDSAVLSRHEVSEVSIHKQAKEWALQNLRDTQVKNEDTGWMITIDKKGIKEATNHSLDSTKSIVGIIDLLKHAKLVKSDPPKTADGNLLQVHLFHHGNVVLDGDPFEALIRVKEFLRTGKRFYSVHAIRKKGSPQNPAPSVSQRHREVGEPSDNSIDQDWERIKRGTDYYSFRNQGELILRFSAALSDRMAGDRMAGPTDAQREAGNYRMQHINFQGLRISIETPKGSRRRPEWPPMGADYGYIKGTQGRDGDHVDVFVGPDKWSQLVFVIDQLGKSGKRFDEHKAMLGFRSENAAMAAYRASYGSGWRVGPVTVMTIDQFKAWLEHGDQTSRIAKQVSRYWIRDCDDLRLDTPDRTIDLYEWSVERHPRWPAHSPGSVGGEFRGAKTSKLWQLVERPDVSEGHALHRSALPEKWRAKAIDWSSRLNELTKHLGGDDEQKWSQTDKKPIRLLLEEMNQMDRDARAEGIQLSDFVNANGMISKDLAERLTGGHRFFNPEAIRDKFKQAAKSNGSNESFDFGANAKAQSKEGTKQKSSSDQLSPTIRRKLNSFVGSEDNVPPGVRDEFRKSIIDAWKMESSQTEDRNTAIRDIMGIFGKHWGLVSARLAKGADVSKIHNFDEAVQLAENRYPNLVSRLRSESNTGSSEEGLAELIRDGIKRMPSILDEDVIVKAWQMMGQINGDNRSAEQKRRDRAELDAIPFAGRFDPMRERYNWSEQDHSRGRPRCVNDIAVKHNAVNNII